MRHECVRVRKLLPGLYLSEFVKDCQVAGANDSVAPSRSVVSRIRTVPLALAASTQLWPPFAL
jgi:hypothetical protein